jgi:predicted dehydrogenase
VLPGVSSYASILGANDRINVAVVGIRSRGSALMGSVYECKNTAITALCDVDRNVLAKRAEALKKVEKKKPQLEEDFRKILDNKEIDAVVIASADHTHTPFSIYALQAGKHVYVEKPLSHNPTEGFLLVKAQKKYNRHVQIGNQYRSAKTSKEAMKDISEGIIGDIHTAKSWYSNNRGSIGTGKNVPVPDWLNWDLWQGPAPRTDYRDNLVHYNWHWFWHWGTGEVNNNGLHELDLCRWAMGVNHPLKVHSQGGRYYYDDDWEFYDTQYVTYEYSGGRSIRWEGHSCNNLQQFDRGRGVVLYGTKGTIILDRNTYQAFDQGRKKLNEVKLDGEAASTSDLVGAGPVVTDHMANFFGAIRDGDTLNSPVEEINFTNHMCHLANYAQKYDAELIIDQKSGEILNNEIAMREMWKRSYEPGWEPNI